MTKQDSPTQLDNEASLILDRYARRSVRHAPHLERYRAIARRERQEIYRSLVSRANPVSMDAIHVLDIGCGEGEELKWMGSLGVPVSHLVGVDLRQDATEATRERLGNQAKVVCGDACKVDLGRSSFDVIICNIVFSSILDHNARMALANRITALLGDRGLLLWTDFVFNNPSNRDVRKVPLREVRLLFPTLTPHLQRRHLAPPLGRTISRLGNVGGWGYTALNCIPWLRTHLVGGLVKMPTTPLTTGATKCE